MAKDAQRILVAGASGSGKSTRVKELTRRFNRVVVFDPMDEYEGEGFTRTTRITGKHSVKEFLQRGWARGFRIAYVPEDGNEATELHKLCQLLKAVQEPYRKCKKGLAIPKLVLLVEEINLSFPETKLPKELVGFGNLCSRGRHYGIEIFGITQRVAEVNTRFRGNANQAYFFRQEDHRDIQTIVSSLGPEWRNQIKQLQDHHYLKRQSGAITKGQNDFLSRGPANQNRAPKKRRAA